jgi:hypothetical protein
MVIVKKGSGRGAFLGSRIQAADLFFGTFLRGAA